MTEPILRRSHWKLAAAFSWLIFTLTLAGWWFYLGLSFLNQLQSHEVSMPETILRQKNMLVWEGMAWMVLLFGGGSTLIYFIAREKVQSQKLRKFLASFSHDVKTALTSLRLQTEILREEVGEVPAIARLESDVLRLQLQLENSLFLASQNELQLFIENMSLKKLVDSMRENWPQLIIELEEDAIIKGDRRAIDSIFGNIIQNALVHGKSHKISIVAKQFSPEMLEIQIADDGRGFKGNLSKLGRLFERHNPSSGSGVGLYSVVALVKHMKGGVVNFTCLPERGFMVSFRIPGELM